MTLRERISTGPMRPYQWVIVFVCVLLNAQDGYDISAVAYASTGMSEEWGLSGTELGTLISIGLVGIVVGSFALSPLADLIGRRLSIILGLGLTVVGMFLGAAAPSPELMTLWRFVTGLGIGGVTASINVVVAEFTNQKWRSLSIGIYAAGFGVGAMLGGIAAAGLLEGYGWRSIFVIGGINSIVSILVVAALLPESIDFLSQRNTPKALARANHTLRRIGIPPITKFDSTASSSEKAPSLLQQIGALFSREYRRRTIILWAAFFFSMFAFYFLSGWTPRLAALSGVTEQTAAIAGSALSMGGSIGAITFGFLAGRFGLVRFAKIFSLVGAAAFVVLGFSMNPASLLIILALVTGLFANGVIVGMFTIAPDMYPPGMRVTGVGWANGVGRTGSILAPFVTGVLVDALVPVSVLYCLAAVLLVALFVTISIYSRDQRNSGGEAELKSPQVAERDAARTLDGTRRSHE